VARGGSAAAGTNGTRLPPTVDLFVASSANGTEIILTLTRTDDDPIFAASLKARIYYVSPEDASPDDMNSINFITVVQSVRRFVVDMSFAGVESISTTVSAVPYPEGGWFYAVQVDYKGIETFGSGPVSVPHPNPIIVIPDLLTQQVQNVTVAMVNVNGIIQLTFRWQLPNVAATPSNPLGPLLGGHVQIWLYNYENRGDWRQFGMFNVRARTLQYETGVKLYMPDYDGLHNVEAHFVASNQAYLYKEPYFTNIPAPFVTLVGGIGP